MSLSVRHIRTLREINEKTDVGRGFPKSWMKRTCEDLARMGLISSDTLSLRWWITEKGREALNAQESQP